MTSLSPLTNTMPQKTSVSGAPPGGVPSLATFLDIIAPLVDVALPTGDPRHETAAPGKVLPEEEDVTADPSLMFIAPAVLPMANPSASAPDDLQSSSPRRRGSIPATVPALSTAAATMDSRLRGNDDTTGVDEISLPARDVLPARPVSQLDPGRAGRGSTGTPEVALSPTKTMEDKTIGKVSEPSHANPPAATPIATAHTTPGIETAARVFAHAIHRAVTAEDPRPHRAADPAAIPVAAATDIAAHAVTATGDARHAPLDLTQRDWPGAMIDRIETLRDAANAADTKIRLIPDALGTIDVALRTEGETVHVHFTAEQAQTRTLLAEAQPRLTELADARGLKLAHSGVDSGPGQQPRQPPPPPAPPPTPRRAREDATTTDHRTA